MVYPIVKFPDPILQRPAEPVTAFDGDLRKLVDEDMPVVAVAPNNDLLEKLKSNLQEVRARGGKLVVFADPETGMESSEGVTVIRMPVNVTALQAPVIFAVPMQLLAYHVAVLKGTDVDQPRNLAKSLTVE